jgi:hypothetical protein
MKPNVDLRLPDELEFRVNHKTGVIESNDPAIYMRGRKRPEPGTFYFMLHWDGREIPVRARYGGRNLGRNGQGQWVSEAYWTVDAIGFPDHISGESTSSYKFESQQEYICAAGLIIRALQTYGGALNKPEWGLFPEFRKITAELSDALKANIYGDLN